MSSYAVTGASRGIGLEFTRQLSAHSSNTVIALVRNPDGAAVLKDLAQQRRGVHLVQADVSDPQSLLAAATKVGEITGGSLDVLIHNAFEMDQMANALSPSQMPLDATALADMFRSSLFTNVYGTIWTTNAFLPLLKKGNQKKVINITSGMADIDFINTTGIAYVVPYGVAKAGTNLITAKYAAEFEGTGFKFLSLSPGWVNTFQGGVPDEAKPFVELMFNQFKRAKPDLTGPLTVEDSVRMQLEVIDRLDDKLNGTVVSHHGNKDWF